MPRKKPQIDKIPGVRDVGLFQEFARWEATPKYLRVTLSLPKSVAEFAEFKGVGERTVRRWRQMDQFKELVEYEKARMVRENTSNSAVSARVGLPRAPKDPRIVARTATKLDPAGWADDPALIDGEELSEAELQYRQVRERLVHMAMEGSTQAADLFMKHWGKAFVEAEQREGGFESLSDQELIEEAVRLVGSERFADLMVTLVVR